MPPPPACKSCWTTWPSRPPGACQRTSPLAGATLVQARVLGYLADTDAALEDLAQTAALLGHPVSPQAIDQRCTPQLADCLQRLLGQAIRRAAASPAAIHQTEPKALAGPATHRYAACMLPPVLRGVSP